jgi:hypothetical protein
VRAAEFLSRPEGDHTARRLRTAAALGGGGYAAMIADGLDRLEQRLNDPAR